MKAMILGILISAVLGAIPLSPAFAAVSAKCEELDKQYKELDEQAQGVCNKRDSASQRACAEFDRKLDAIDADEKANSCPAASGGSDDEEDDEGGDERNND